MTTRSIFQKICPACMLALPVDTGECTCGHLFDHDDNSAGLSSEAIRVQAEELYESYLAARAEQAASAVMAAQAEYAGEPGSAGKSERVAEAIREAEAARAALAAQSARLTEMKQALPPATLEKKSAAVAIKPKARPIPARPVERKPRAATVTPIQTRRGAAKPAPVSVKPRQAATAPKTPAAPVPVQARTPGPSFRRAQAARAERIMRQAETTSAVKAVIREEEIAAAPKPPAAKILTVETAAKPAAPAPTPKPVETKRAPKEETAAIATPAAPVLTRTAPRLLTDRKECPNCTASVEARINRCRCGYEFPTSENLMPSLAMSEEERAAFARLFGAG